MTEAEWREVRVLRDEKNRYGAELARRAEIIAGLETQVRSFLKVSRTHRAAVLEEAAKVAEAESRRLFEQSARSPSGRVEQAIAVALERHAEKVRALKEKP